MKMLIKKGMRVLMAITFCLSLFVIPADATYRIKLINVADFTLQEQYKAYTDSISFFHILYKGYRPHDIEMTFSIEDPTIAVVSKDVCGGFGIRGMSYGKTQLHITMTAVVTDPTEEPLVFDKPIECTVPVWVYNKVDSLKTNKTEITLTDGKTKKITAQVKPLLVDDTIPAWNSRNNFVAVVRESSKQKPINKNGGTYSYFEVVAKSVGNTVIDAYAGNYSLSISVTVNPKKIKNLKISKKGRKITFKISKGKKSYKTYIAYRKKGAKNYRFLKITKAKKFTKKLKKGRYQFKACSYVEKGGQIYKSVYTKAITVKIQ